MSTIITSQPDEQIMTVNEIKHHLHVDHREDDSYFGLLITAARQYIESFTMRAILPTVFQMNIDSFEDVIQIPNPPLNEVISILYVNTSGKTKTVSTHIYNVDTSSIPGRISRVTAQSWPTTLNDINVISVHYSGGWEVSDIPQDLVICAKMLIGSWYENRESTTDLKLMTVPLAVKNILNHYRTFATGNE